MSHPPIEHNPHVYADFAGNPVTVHTTDGSPAVPVDAEGNPVDSEGGEQQWQEPETVAGTDSSTSSSTADRSSKSPEPSTPSPAPDAEPPSEPDPTTPSTARSTDGAGTEPKATRTRRSAGK